MNLFFFEYLSDSTSFQDQQESDGESSSSSEYDFDTLFAPDDYEPYILNRKDDRFGLGYSALSRHSVLGNLTGEYGSEAGSSKSHLNMKDKGRKVRLNLYVPFYVFNICILLEENTCLVYLLNLKKLNVLRFRSPKSWAKTLLSWSPNFRVGSPTEY